MGSRERVFTILVVEDQGFIASEFEDAVRRNRGRVLGPTARVSEALALIESAPCDAALLDVTLEHGETVYPVAERLRAKRIPQTYMFRIIEDVILATVTRRIIAQGMQLRIV
jgi:CheY-like chemotaxis protein